MGASDPPTAFAFTFISHKAGDMRLDLRNLLNELLYFFDFPDMRTAFRTLLKRHDNGFVHFFGLGTKQSDMSRLATGFIRLLLAFGFRDSERSGLAKRRSFQGSKSLIKLFDLFF